MDTKLDIDLEEQIINELKPGKYTNNTIERALLMVSGLTEESQIQGYQKKIEQLQEGFAKYLRKPECREKSTDERLLSDLFNLKGNDITKAINLFDYLWTKPNRTGKNFRLTDAIDSQLSHDLKNGVNCVGLTSLYTVLGLRNNLNLGVLFNEKHILSILYANGREIPIENFFPYGFGHGNKDYLEGDLI